MPLRLDLTLTLADDGATFLVETTDVETTIPAGALNAPRLVPNILQCKPNTGPKLAANVRGARRPSDSPPLKAGTSWARHHLGGAGRGPLHVPAPAPSAGRFRD